MQSPDPDPPLCIRRGAYLPHWTREGETYAICFRLADALPQSVADGWNFERRNIVETANALQRPLSEQELQRLAHIFSTKVESYLDAGHGACHLRNPRCAETVLSALDHFDGSRYELAAWCIMPNHVHVAVSPLAKVPLASILHTWKSFTARRCKDVLGLSHDGSPFWQPEYYDHLVRDVIDFDHQVRYILNNPIKARLENWPWVGAKSNVAAQLGQRLQRTGSP
jgi:REP element-mobilizing transposase RayT